MLKDGEKGVILQQDRQSYAIGPHIPCGLIEPQALRKLADVAEKYQCRAVKITSAARIALIASSSVPGRRMKPLRPRSSADRSDKSSCVASGVSSASSMP